MSASSVSERRSREFFGRGCSCAVLVVLASIVAGAGIVAGTLWIGSSGVFKRSHDGELIVYGAVRDRKEGPSSVAPSGRSGRTLKTAQGVIGSRAKEIEYKRALRYAKKPKVCRNKAHATDQWKALVFQIDREMRKSEPLSWNEEKKIGQRLHQGLRKHFGHKLDSPQTKQWRAYLARVAQPLLAEVKRREVKYQFHVIDAPIVNAFALPGGHIYFFTGLLENRGAVWLQNEAQLAGILAHEISHVDLEHTSAVFQYLRRLGVLNTRAEMSTASLVGLARHAFSSNQEDEADANATRMLYYAQYSPRQFVRLWKNWEKNASKRSAMNQKMPGSSKGELANLLRTHSPSRKRACTVIQSIDKVRKEHKKKGKSFDRFYVGKSNFRKKKSRTNRQY